MTPPFGSPSGGGIVLGRTGCDGLGLRSAPMSARLCRRLAVLGLLVMVAAGCQMQVAVDIQVADDGSGVVIVGVGLDDDALARVGDLQRQVRVDDLRVAGWEVSDPAKEPDGLTWVRASKPFADPEAAAGVMAELTGPGGAFRDFTVTREEDLLGVTTEVTGTVDLTGGPAVFSDEALANALGGDPFGGTLAAIEQEEGRPVSEMVDFQVTVSVPGASPTVVTPSFTDAEPTQIAVSSTTGSWVSKLWIWAVVVAVGLVALIALRRAFRHTRH
jgi:hypothetical protein